MNKYQGELEKLKAWCYLYPETKLIEDKFNHSFATLQELIDNYDKLETKCFDLEQELELVYGDSNEKLEDSLIECDIKCQKLEKALDKACELIDLKFDCPFEEYEYQFKDKRNCYECDSKSSDCWKEYLLKESEK